MTKPASHDLREHNDDLRWSALLYVLGELSDEEAATFEERLESDQETREAVAEAVVLNDALCASHIPLIHSGVPTPERRVPRGRRRAPLAIAAACVLLVGALVGAFRTGATLDLPASLSTVQQDARGPIAPEGPEAPAIAAFGASRLIELWSRSSEVWGETGPGSSEEVAEDFVAEDFAAAEIADAEFSESDAAPGRVPQSELTVPGWMLAAVAETDVLDNGASPPPLEEN